MNRTWCYACGAPVVGGRSRLAPLCDKCAQSGRQVPQDRLRWVIRTTDGGSRGPLSMDGVVDQLGRGALGPDDKVARVGGEWSRLCEHPDFRRYFLPGSADAERLGSQREADRKDKGAYVTRRRARTIGAALFAITGVGLAAVSTKAGLFVVPEPIVNQVAGLFKGASDGIGDQINAATNKEVALENARQKQVLPGEAMVAEVRGRWPEVTGPASLHLTRGRIALWTGTSEANEAARAHFEQALALVPDDAETNSGLARAAARRIYIDSGLTDMASQAAARASALAPESPPPAGARRGRPGHRRPGPGPGPGHPLR